MRRCCQECGRLYDDEYRSTICPHDGINGLCVEHDLYGCTFSHESDRRRALIAAAERYGEEAAYG